MTSTRKFVVSLALLYVVAIAIGGALGSVLVAFGVGFWVKLMICIVTGVVLGAVWPHPSRTDEESRHD